MWSSLQAYSLVISDIYFAEQVQKKSNGFLQQDQNREVSYDEKLNT